MVYANMNSLTCDLDGTSKELTSEVTMILHQFYELISKHHGKEFADKAVVEVGRMAVNVGKEQ